MCGILGVVGSSSKLTDKTSLLESLRSQSHRGPDSSDHYLDSKAFLGHNRLAIIDLSQGGQPFSLPSQPWVLIFNGEIYNFKEIRIELESYGHVFLTNSDTEVLYQAWMRWGADSVDKFRGMYAFAIYNKLLQEVYLARDEFGIKPLYYVLESNGVVFASEMKTVLRVIQGLEWSIEGVAEFLQWQIVTGERTLDARILKVMPGQVLRFSVASSEISKIKTKRKEEFVSKDKETFKQVMSRSVAAHTISDVGFGVLLSGGLDSTLVAKILRESGYDFTTYSLDFDDPKFSELPYINYAAKTLGVKNKTYKVGLADFEEVLLKLPKLLDEPIGDSSLIPTYLISSFIRHDHKVALSGDGGDEMFGGYYSHAEVLKIYHGNNIERLKALRSYLIRGNPFPWKGQREWAWNEHLSQRYFVEPSPVEILTGIRVQRSKPQKMRSMVAEAMEDDVNYYMVDDILAKVDRMSMKTSLEVRVPFIDRHVYAYSRSLTEKDLFGPEGLTTKYLLKKELEPTLGSDFVHRKKMGFGIPVQKWTRKIYGDRLLEMFTGSQMLSNLPGKDYLHSKTREYLAGDDAASNLVWGCLILSLWEESVTT